MTRDPELVKLSKNTHPTEGPWVGLLVHGVRIIGRVTTPGDWARMMSTTTEPMLGYATEASEPDSFLHFGEVRISYGDEPCNDTPRVPLDSIDVWWLEPKDAPEHGVKAFTAANENKKKINAIFAYADDDAAQPFDGGPSTFRG